MALLEIARLKRERHAYILAHNYAPRDIQDTADVVGDSLYLGQKGAESDAEILLEASVLLMNEILAIMKKPYQKVLAPDLGALCSLAAHADVEKIRWWKRAHPNGIVISYVNTYLEVKAESDYCCASANAAKVILHVLGHSDARQPILFLPDVYLGFYAAKLLEQQNQSLDRLWLMMGACHVHDRIRPCPCATAYMKSLWMPSSLSEPGCRSNGCWPSSKAECLMRIAGASDLFELSEGFLLLG